MQRWKKTLSAIKTSCPNLGTIKDKERHNMHLHERRRSSKCYTCPCSLLFPLFLFHFCSHWSFTYPLLFALKDTFSLFSLRAFCQTYLYLIILTTSYYPLRNSSIMAIQHRNCPAVTTWIHYNSDSTTAPRDDQQHGSNKSYRRWSRDWPWSHLVMLQGKRDLSSSSSTVIYL